MHRNLSFKWLALAALTVMCGMAVAGTPITSFLPPDALAALAAAGAMGGMPFMIGETAPEFKEIQKLLEDQGRAFETFKKTNDERIDAIKKGLPTADLEAKLDKIEKDLTDLTEAKTAIEEIQKKLNRFELDPASEGKSPADRLLEAKTFNLQRKATAGANYGGDIDLDTYVGYKRAVDLMLRKGLDALGADERKTLQAGVDPDGGYLLPAATVGRTVAKVYETSLMRQWASVQSISTQSISGLVDNDEADAGWTGETSTRDGNDGTPQVGKWEIVAHEMYSQPKATQTLLDDAAVDVEGWLAGKVSTKFGRVENNAFCVGNGVAKARGFCGYDTVTTDDDSRAWGVMQHITTGTNGDFGGTAATAQDKLLDLIGQMRPEYLGNSAWFTRREVITKIRKFKDGNNLYLWQPSLQMGKPDLLLAYPVAIFNDMPALSTNGLSMAFGDMRETYLIVDRIGIRVLRDPFTSKPYIKFYTTKRTGGGVVNFESLKFLKFSA
jgi:HK97 family phage major capsid protein